VLGKGHNLEYGGGAGSMLRVTGSLRIQHLLFETLLILVSVPAWADKRVALVIGNGAYMYAGTPDNPKSDAADMVAVLKKSGLRLSTASTWTRLAWTGRFWTSPRRSRAPVIGLFFYAGHGLQSPRTMERETQTTILFLDACRNNPLARNLAREDASNPTASRFIRPRIACTRRQKFITVGNPNSDRMTRAGKCYKFGGSHKEARRLAISTITTIEVWTNLQRQVRFDTVGDDPRASK
jgi:Caspase domain